MAREPIEIAEIERAIKDTGYPTSKVSAELSEVTLPDGSKATVGLKDGQLDVPRSKDLKEKLTLLICDYRAGLGPLPAIVGDDATKIMGLMKQIPGYMPEISIEMIAKLVHCPEANADDLMMLAVTAKNIGANPFLPGEIFLIKPKEKDNGTQPAAYTVIGQTLVAKKLAAVPGFKRSIRGIIVENKDGIVSFKTGNYYNPARETLTGAWNEIQFDDRETARKEIPLHEVIGKSPNWQKSPGLMCSKCAFMQNVREAEPGIFGDCYDIDEFGGQIKMDESREVKA